MISDKIREGYKQATGKDFFVAVSSRWSVGREERELTRIVRRRTSDRGSAAGFVIANELDDVNPRS